MQTSLYNSLLQPDLRMMVVEDDAAGLSEFCRALYPGVAAEVLEGLDAETTWKVLQHAEPLRQAEIFQFLSLPFQVELVDRIDRKALSRIIEEMAPDDRVDLLERMDPDHVESLLPLIAQAERSDIRKLLSYPDTSAGSIMTTEYASLPANITAGEALNRLRVQAPSRETIYYVYITDEGRHLIGFLSLRKLIQTRPDRILEDIMQRDVICVRVDDDREHVANEILRYDFIAIPVVDNQNRLVGIVTHDDAADVLIEEAEEDAQLQAAVEPLQDGYLDTPLLILARKRGVWLVILLGAAFVTAWVISLLEGSGRDRGWMMMFLPMVLASGGNSGSQAATLIIRTLAVDAGRGTFRQVALKELLVGLMLGATLAILSFCVSWLLMIGETAAVSRACVVSSTVLMVVVMGAVNGAMLPMFFKRVMNFDPALMSNPLIASLSDMMGVVIYFNIAKVLLM
jgi:magnesium transporter